MKTEKRFTDVCILDICTSDYFQGYHLPVLAIPVYYDMTNGEFCDAIKSEINSIYDLLSEAFTAEELMLLDEYIDKLMDEPSNQLFTGIISADQEANDEECVYAYLSLCKPVVRHGIQFLNE